MLAMGANADVTVLEDEEGDDAVVYADRKVNVEDEDRGADVMGIVEETLEVVLGRIKVVEDGLGALDDETVASLISKSGSWHQKCQTHQSPSVESLLASI